MHFFVALGCYHNGSLYGDGSFIPTLEPCLSCRCNTKTLICSLKICPEMPVPPPRGCVLVQKKNSCCPYLSCLRIHNYYNGLSRRIASYLDHYERESIDRVVNDNFLQKRSDDDDFDGSGEICVKNGTVYKSGSAMASSSLCSYCYCIGGQQRCVKPKCMLPLDGCKPIFVDSTCCPVRYDCTSKSAGKSWQQSNARKTSNKHYQRMSQRLQRHRGCNNNNDFYMEGQKMPSEDDKPCDICFCIRGVRKCAPKKCSPALRSCIPVIPKGQCCPSSYDCGPSRDWDRSYQSRQIGLFSWILGGDENDNNITETAAVIPIVQHQVSSTSEKSIFDVIREGLELIDTNGNHILNELNNTEASNFTTTTTTLRTTEKHDENLNLVTKVEEEVDKSSEEEEDDEDDGISFLDLLLGTKSNLTQQNITSSTTSENPVSEQDSEDYKDYENVSFLDILLGNDVKNLNKTSENLTTTEGYDFDYFGLFNENDTSYDYLGVSDSTIENDSTSTEGSGFKEESTTDSTEGRSEWFDENSSSTTSTQEGSTVSTIYFTEGTESVESRSTESFEDYSGSDENDISTFIANNISTEDVQVGSLSTEEDSDESTVSNSNHDDSNEASEENYISSTEILDKIEISPLNVELDNNLIQKDADTYQTLSNSSTESTDFVNSEKDKLEVNELASEVEQEIDVFSSILTGLESFLLKNSNETEISNITENDFVGVKEAQHDKMDQNITNFIDSNTKIQPTNLITELENSTQPFINITSTPCPTLVPALESLPTTSTLNPEPLSKEVNETLPTTSTIFSTTPTPQKSNKSDSLKSVSSSTTPTPIVIATNPSILEISIDSEDYGHGTLPPSLPNLEIIPFLPIDALPLTEKRQTRPPYPTITERHGSSAENIWALGTFESDVKAVKPYDNSDRLPSITYPNSDGGDFEETKATYPPEANRNGFSPPKETEGGFVPKEPIVDGNLYYGTKLITELTTVTPLPVATKALVKPSSSEKSIIAITSTDPFKDVIKTEPPPNLVSLIEDKEKRLANRPTPYEDKEIIHITTDSNYNYTSEYKQAQQFEFNNLSLENVSFTEKNNPAENFPIDRIDIGLPPLPIDNDVNLDENFPLDRQELIQQNKPMDNIDLLNSDYVDGDSVGFGSFLDYFLGPGHSQKNETVTIPPFKALPVTSALSLSDTDSDIPINFTNQTDENIKISISSNSSKNSIPDLNILQDIFKPDHKLPESELYKPVLHRKAHPLKDSADKKVTNKPVTTTDPFKGLPGLIPSYPVKRPSEIKPIEDDIDLLLSQINKKPFTVGAYKILENESSLSNSDPYVVNPIDIDALKKQQQHNDGKTETYSKPEHTNSLNDPAGILKLAGCNIYGRMYRVGRIISELSNACLECKCTEIGVSCISLECLRSTQD